MVRLVRVRLPEFLERTQAISPIRSENLNQRAMFPVDVTVFLIETGLDDRSDALDGLDLNLNSETNPKL